MSATCGPKAARDWVTRCSLARPAGRRFERDYRSGELAGVAFHGEWMFFNIQRPGVTFAVTGPWARGAL